MKAEKVEKVCEKLWIKFLKNHEYSGSRAQELLARTNREMSPTIDSLMKRYGNNNSSAHRIKDSTVSRRESMEIQDNENSR